MIKILNNFMKFILISLIVLTFHLIFLFDQNEGWFNQLLADVERFLFIDDTQYQYLFLVYFSSLLISLIIFVSEKFFKLDNYFKFFTVNIFAHLLIFYFLRIYISRFNLILIVFLIPLLLLLIKKFSYVYNILFVVLFSFGLIFYINSTQINTIENNLVANESECENYNHFINSDCNLDNKEIQYGEKFQIDKYLNFENNFLQNFNLNNQFAYDKYSLCCEIYNYSNIAGKPLGYIDIYKDNLFFINGSGFLFFVKEDEINKKTFKFTNISSNLLDITDNELILESEYKNFGWEGVKDILIVEDKLFVSIIDEKKDNCTNVQVLMGEINFDYIEFSKIFSPEECVNRFQYGYSTYGSGGKMSAYKSNEILLSTGDVFLFDKAQDTNSILGKILKINYLSLDYEIVSIGHRNPQGLYYVDDYDILVETEHGPKGGDEVNLINLNKLENFGWPISSYGDHYTGEILEEAPLHKSHLEYGFKEPLHYFDYELVGSHGISSVEKYIDKSFIIGTLNGRVFYDVTINFQQEKITDIQTYYINKRIRDIKVSSNSERIYLILEDTPSLGVLYPKKNTD